MDAFIEKEECETWTVGFSVITGLLRELKTEVRSIVCYVCLKNKRGKYRKIPRFFSFLLSLLNFPLSRFEKGSKEAISKR